MPKDFFANRDLLLQKKLTLTLCNDEHLERVANALNAPTRRKILSLLTANSYTIQEIADRLNMSLSNTSFHVKFLQKAGLVNLTQNHSKRGNEKIVALEKHCLEILFINEAENSFPSSSHAFSTELPVGSFTLFDIVPPCGIADADGNLIGAEALPDIFYNYKRIKGEIIWFTEGYLEYHVSNAAIKNKVLEALQISCEVCSECANYNNSFKSDITFWMNDKEIGTYTSPGDLRRTQRQIYAQELAGGVHAVWNAGTDKNRRNGRVDQPGKRFLGDLNRRFRLYHQGKMPAF